MTPTNPTTSQDGNGEISVTELRTTMHELGDLLTEEEIMNFMQVHHLLVRMHCRVTEPIVRDEPAAHNIISAGRLMDEQQHVQQGLFLP